MRESAPSSSTGSSIVKKVLRRIVSVPLVAFGFIQLVPYGRDHTNPAVRREPAWPSPRVRELAVRACFDCHSNESRWPWYSNVAPISWLIQKDVVDGRRHLNFSEWDRPQRHAREASEELMDGEMPPALYLPLHAEARLSDAEKAELRTGLDAVAVSAIRGGSDDRGGRSGKDDDQDK